MTSRFGRWAFRVGSLAAAGGVGAGVYTLLTFSSQVKQQEFYSHTLATLHGYEEGVKLLGEPITDTPPLFKQRSTTAYQPGSDVTWTDGYVAKLNVDVKGKNNQGTLHSWCHKTGDQWTVDKCDLEVGSRRWTFYINPQSSTLFVPSTEDDAHSKDFPKQWYLDTQTATETGTGTGTGAGTSAGTTSEIDSLGTITTGSS